MTLPESGSFIPFWYDLPKERIAQRPALPYDAAKLLVADGHGALMDSTFQMLDLFLKPSDTLVFNNTRVLSARLFGTVSETGAQVELLLLRKEGDNWRALGRPLKRLKSGRTIVFKDGQTCHVVERRGDELNLSFSIDERSFDDWLERVGCMPIPPYIRGGAGDEQDRADYQTRFAQLSGSVAAPTASLHFTDSLMEKIERCGCRCEQLTLHVSTASFLPLVKEGGRPLSARPGHERFICDHELMSRLAERRDAGERIIAVGTTVVRALESMAQIAAGQRGQGDTTDLFIAPGFRFQICSGMVTNFHQPGTSHLLLVEAFVGRKRLEEIYNHALFSDYRFLSYGDGMFLTGGPANTEA